MNPAVQYAGWHAGLRRSARRAALGLWAAGLATGAAWAAPAVERSVPVTSFRLVERVSGPVNYYSVVTAAQPAYIRSQYRPGLKTAVLGYSFSGREQASTARLGWRWRARALPKGGNECAPGKGDSAAVVYVSWKRAFRYYTIKYVWSAVGPRGAVCDKKRNPLLAQDTVILESGGPLDEWKSVDLDLKAEFRQHFEAGDPKADVPPLLGIGLMSDGDQTDSPSSADFADFSLR